MKLTTRSRYGTRLLLDIALHSKDGHPVPSKQTAAREGLSLKYLEKLVKVLKEEGYIVGKRGPNGGNTLIRKPREISIGEVARILDGEDQVLGCEGDVSTCPRAAVCLKRSIWDDASLAMYKMLDSFSLADLMKDAYLCPQNPPPKE
ncbi:Rrf2 family transcriptional regulator [Pseudodesulfovibrio sp. JC047]|uniref:RrF2 family transcriptional regulator n=1 Tax=Pseudodesulfovibrio sp. JC047 TaxID=2683199 RepID=UPI0013D48327|nr:Rrf2 family transcriptional regulator [Pseudodesulfovibrio sp. JC047]NDV18705.1 Rrf2 family transcriptional regulator [Pseudodesulfovibrio sp. JC047]